MADRIERIGRISYNTGRVEPVRPYTPEECAAKIQEIEQAAKEREEIRAYLAKFPNPDNLSFAELLEQDDNYFQIQDYELDYILDIGKQNTKDYSGVIVDIENK